MIVLGIDPATRCGWCLTDGAERTYGTWDLSRYTRHPGEKLLMLGRAIVSKWHEVRFTVLAYEEASFGAGGRNGQIQMTTIAFHNKLRGVIESVACELGADVRPLNPMTIKAFATGNGHAKKDQMVRAAETHYGIRGIDDNAADAIFIAELALRPDCWSQKAQKKARPKRRREVSKLF